MNREQAHVLAWSLAWEGTISLTSQKDPTARHGFYLRARMDIFNTDKELLEKFQRYIGNYGYIALQRNATKDNWAKCHRWRPHGQKEIYELLKEIIDILPAKREQALLLLEFLEIRKAARAHQIPYSPREFEIYDEIHKLNCRGRH